MSDSYYVTIHGLSGGLTILAVLMVVLGIVPTHLLLRGALRRAFWLVAPLVGWAVLVVTAYMLLTGPQPQADSADYHGRRSADDRCLGIVARGAVADGTA